MEGRKPGQVIAETAGFVRRGIPRGTRLHGFQNLGKPAVVRQAAAEAVQAITFLLSLKEEDAECHFDRDEMQKKLVEFRKLAGG